MRRVIDAAARVVFPGQGAMPDCMRFLRDAGLEPAVRRAAASKPLLAVCIGEQMLFDASDETRTPGTPTPGLGLFAGRVERFRGEDLATANGTLKVPHMGWNRVAQTARHALWEGVARRQLVLFRAQLLRGPDRSGHRHPAKAITVAPLPARWRGIIFLPRSSIPKRAPLPD